MRSVSSCAGFVYTWGLGKSGEQGHNNIDNEFVCAFPKRVIGIPKSVFVACGERCSGIISEAGEIFMWGSGKYGRLGQGNENNYSTPQIVKYLQGIRITCISIGEDHVGCVGGEEGNVYTWGNNRNGGLGPPSKQRDSLKPTLVLINEDLNTPLIGITQISCSAQACACVNLEGQIIVWGSNQFGKLGLGQETEVVIVPTIIPNLPPISFVSMGSLYGGAITKTGEVWMWGFGGGGNLGIGTRLSSSIPVKLSSLNGIKIVYLHCTVGQINPATKENDSTTFGREGPHTIAISDQGEVYTWGTCHKGILGNMKNHVLAFNGDELFPYKIGGIPRDYPESGKTNYFEGIKLIQGVASSIHSSCVDDNGNVYSFGCGSDGRMGVSEYLNGLSGGRSRRKCYLSKPTVIETFQKEKLSVLGIDTSRRHMIALVVPK